LLARLDVIEIQKFGDIQVLCTPPIEEVMMQEFEPIGITELYCDENGNIH